MFTKEELKLILGVMDLAVEKGGLHVGDIRNLVPIIAKIDKELSNTEKPKEEVK